MKTIKDYKNYKVDELGNVYSMPNRTRKGTRILSPIMLNNGYATIDLMNNGVKTRKLIHRLVAETFISNPENKPQVNHINGIKSDNRVCNLEWCTRSENQKHAIKTGLRSAKGVKNSQSKLTESEVIDIRILVKCGYGNKHISNKYNISEPTVCDIKSGRSWSHI